MKKTSVAFIGIAALLLQSASAQVLFTTTNDFSMWQTGSAFPQMAVAYPDSDGSTVNGLGNTNFPGGAGTGGALQIVYPQGGAPYAYTAGSPGEQGYTNFIAALEQTNKVFTFDYTTAGTNGTYFNLGIVVNCQGRFDELLPISTTALGGGWRRATLNWAGEATNLINQAAINLAASTNVPPRDFGYFQLEVIYNSDHANTTPFYVDNFAIRNPSPPAFKLFTTTSDFTGWTAEPDTSSVGPTNLDLDGPPGGATNGVGNLTAPGAVGPTGALSIVWASNTFGVASYSPYETSNTAFIASMLQASSVSFDYTTPVQGTGTYFEAGIVVDCQGRFDELFPSTSAVALSNGISRATIDWVSEGQALTAQKAINTNTFTYFRIGIVWNSDYAPGGVPFQVDNITVVTNPPAAFVIPTSTGTVVVAENCAVTNGAINPGETVTVNFALQNTGNSTLSNVTATLQANSSVILPSGAQSYGTLLSDGGTATNSFTFTGEGICGGNLIATLALQTNSVFYRTVPFSFTLGSLGASLTNNSSSGGEAIAIPDNNPVGITNSITVNATGSVSHVSVSLRINHTYEGDLQMYVIHPDGTMVELKAADPAGTGANFGSGATDCTGTFTVFDDSGATPIAAGSAPFTAGPYKPAQFLSALNGKPAQGTWKVYIEDTGPGDVGTLYCWQLQIAYQPYSCCSGFAVTDPFTTWENHYFTPAQLANPAVSGGNADPDHDGLSNTNEFLAGFNPTNSAAYPHVIAIARQGGDMNVTYLGANGDSTWSPGIASRTNVLEFSTGVPGSGAYSNNFVSANVTNILSGGTGVGVVTNMVDPGGATGKTRYYRIRVIAP